MGNLQAGSLDLADLKYLPRSHDEFPKLLLRPGDLLFNRTNSAELVGKSAVYSGTPAKCSFASYLIRARFCDPACSRFAAFFINSMHGRRWIASVVSQQVGQANVSGSKLAALSIPLPPLAEQDRIVAEVERRLSIADEVAATVDSALARAARLRQSILKRAFEGKLVPQNPNDEPASVLLARIRAEREAANTAKPKKMRARS
jgi:type I restriction enzyme S subunit